MGSTYADKQFEAIQVEQAILRLGKPQKAKEMMRFFKTGPGEYAEGDVFCGVSSPEIRKVVKSYRGINLSEIQPLLAHKVHEVRACGLLMLVDIFQRQADRERAAAIACYLENKQFINNWDLVDISCSILGEWVRDKERNILFELAKSENMWEQRIGVVATLPLIKVGDFKEIFALVDMLYNHPHDLMHKALGWMLREVGKKDKQALLNCLESHFRGLPRTTLRYAIERFPEEERQWWLKRR